MHSVTCILLHAFCLFFPVVHFFFLFLCYFHNWDHNTHSFLCVIYGHPENTKEDWWDYGLARRALLGLSMTNKHGGKKFLLKIGLEVGMNVLLIFKTNVGDDLYMIVCLNDL